MSESRRTRRNFRKINGVNENKLNRVAGEEWWLQTDAFSVIRSSSDRSSVLVSTRQGLRIGLNFLRT